MRQAMRRAVREFNGRGSLITHQHPFLLRLEATYDFGYLGVAGIAEFTRKANSFLCGFRAAIEIILGPTSTTPAASPRGARSYARAQTLVIASSEEVHAVRREGGG